MSGRKEEMEDESKTAREESLVWLRSSIVLAALGQQARALRPQCKPQFPDVATPSRNLHSYNIYIGVRAFKTGGV